MLIRLLCLEQKRFLSGNRATRTIKPEQHNFFSFQSAFRLAAVKPKAKYVITTAFESKNKYHNELTRKQSKNMKTY